LFDRFQPFLKGANVTPTQSSHVPERECHLPFPAVAGLSHCAHDDITGFDVIRPPLDRLIKLDSGFDRRGLG
jgi:hypothetical protein